MNKFFTSLTILAIGLLVGCNLPGSHPSQTMSPEVVFTQVAQTVAAELTRVSLLPSPSFLNLPTSSLTPEPSEISSHTPAQILLPCLLVGYNRATIDVTVPDDTIMSPNQAFIKTWRLKNIGTCTWDSTYQLVFDRGNGMGIPSNYSQPLTNGTVAPGQEVDVSVNLIAPTKRGTFTGYWRFRDPHGVYFGIGGLGSWTVKIIVVK